MKTEKVRRVALLSACQWAGSGNLIAGTRDKDSLGTKKIQENGYLNLRVERYGDDFQVDIVTVDL